MTGLLILAFLILLAGVVAVPLASRFGLGSVLGYLLAGMAIGPFGLGLVGEEGQDVMHFAEFGVVMMLFLVGLELRPELLWKMRVPVLGLGGAQVAVTTAVFTGAALLLGLSWQAALAVGHDIDRAFLLSLVGVAEAEGRARLTARLGADVVGQDGPYGRRGLRFEAVLAEIPKVLPEALARVDGVVVVVVGILSVIIVAVVIAVAPSSSWS